MDYKEIYRLEGLLDKTKFADFDVAIHYGNKLLNNINDIQKRIKVVADYLEKLEMTPETKNITESLWEALLETKMMQIAIDQMQSYLRGYKELEEPSQIEEIAASKGWDFTEDELKKLEKFQQPDFTPEEKAKLETFNPKNISLED